MHTFIDHQTTKVEIAERIRDAEKRRLVAEARRLRTKPPTRPKPTRRTPRPVVRWLVARFAA